MTGEQIYNDMRRIWGVTLPNPTHQPKQFQRLLDTPVNLSIGPAALANSSMHPILLQIPLERLLFETDDSNTTIESVYLQFCHITGHRIEPLCQQIEQNFIAIFGT